MQRQQVVQHFWRRWSVEYVHQLQARVKWNSNVENQVKIDDIILIRNENAPPLKWCLGRVKEVHPGADKIVRVVTIRCSDGSMIKRPLSKICVLPLEHD
ncbi:hypothetical protein NQ317_008333 [Molorchus minor]|uniref:DUF5641 domain-containing protein n=1 Tax=Molorchus minor TaxID=1323400 RepID=A0ABQ9JQP2_9CUCU|nr:hypothetical protein NQ317_008333 [Molorchus minor]